MKPLISIITPFYNASHTLPYALRSLLFQSYQNWECILVDDGSEDNPRSVINQFQDSRILYHRLDMNRGRGAARQFALDQAKGDYLCFLDADDWIYPHKLQSQLEAMQDHQNLAILGSGMAVVNLKNELIGVHGFSPGQKKVLVFSPMTHPAPLKIPFPSSIIRMEVARQAAFDPQLRRSEDSDFLMQIMFNHKYGLLPDINYVYRELVNINKDDILLAYKSRIQVINKHQMRNPLLSSMHINLTKIKMLAYRIAFVVKLEKELIKTRSRRPTELERSEYQSALKQLESSFLDI